MAPLRTEEARVSFATLAASLATASLVLYPAFGDEPVTAPAAARDTRTVRIEMLRDLGPVVEMLIVCPKGAAIVTWSKPERLFCGPSHGCATTLAVVAGRVCG
jgi:hypothetical protein